MRIIRHIYEGVKFGVDPTKNLDLFTVISFSIVRFCAENKCCSLWTLVSMFYLYFLEIMISPTLFSWLSCKALCSLTEENCRALLVVCAGGECHSSLHNGLTLSCALHEFVIGLIVLWTDMVAPPTELVQAWPAPCTCFTVHTGLTVCRAFCKDSTHSDVSVNVVAKCNTSIFYVNQRYTLGSF